MPIAYKESRETRTWLRLLKDTAYLTPKEYDSIAAEADDLCRMPSSILIATRPSQP